MATDFLFDFRFIRERKADPDAILTQIARKSKRAAYRTMVEVVLPRLKDAAPGTVAKQHFRVVKVGESTRSVKYGITVDKKHHYIFYTLPPGTQPHDIYPRRRKMLAFFWDSAPAGMGRLADGRVLARHVRHPGYKGDAWNERAMKGIDLRALWIARYADAQTNANENDAR